MGGNIFKEGFAKNLIKFMCQDEEAFTISKKCDFEH